MQQIRIPYGFSPGVPVVKAFIRYSRFTAFAPSSGEIFWTVPETISQDNSNNAIFGDKMEVNPAVGYAGPRRYFKNLNNYIKYVDNTFQEENVYEDSDPIKEQDQRTFIITKPFFQNKDEPFENLEPEKKKTERIAKNRLNIRRTIRVPDFNIFHGSLMNKAKEMFKCYNKFRLEM